MLILLNSSNFKTHISLIILCLIEIDRVDRGRGRGIHTLYNKKYKNIQNSSGERIIIYSVKNVYCTLPIIKL